MSTQDQSIQNTLSSLIDPLTQQTWFMPQAYQNAQFHDGCLSLTLRLGYPVADRLDELKTQAIQALSQLQGVRRVDLKLETDIVAHTVQRGLKLMPGVKNIIAVASGKGGVGKSTTAVNLALALKAQGAKVGLLDADIYGPSQPTMMGIEGRPESEDGQTMKPLVNHGIEVMSIGFLVEPGQAMIWRGPMATQALEQLARQTQWGELDYLVVDLPPGTGDIQLSLSQRTPITGAVIVTTPQDIALIDARKGINLFEKVGVPILGLVENMAVHICEQCGHAEHVFGADGGKAMAAELSLSYLGALPLSRSIREQADSGQPTVVAAPGSTEAKLYLALAAKVAVAIARQSKDYSSKFPNITVSPNT